MTNFTLSSIFLFTNVFKYVSIKEHNPGTIKLILVMDKNEKKLILVYLLTKFLVIGNSRGREMLTS
jgi:hypothetical protein